MPQSLSIAQIDVYDAIIQEQGVAGAKAVYEALLAQGYEYAGWAGGVASGNSITGQSALGFLQGTALMGIGGAACRDLTPAQTDAIRVDMARSYLATLQSIGSDSGFVDRDIKFDELSDFHNDVFTKHHLSIDNWTLHTPMELLRQAKGDAAVEALWVRLRDTGGSGIDALLASTALANQVGRMAFSSDPQLSEQAQAWLDQTPGFANFAQIERMLDILARTLGSTVDDLATSIGNWSRPISEAVNQFFIASLTNPPAPRDPLVLDLDGDGIEAVPINPASPTLFDHNADGSRTATGWIKPDDGLVVLDLDGNGTIDSGRELFGDNTMLPSGQLARNGFEAIAQYDGNEDGHINAADPVFAQLQIWRDANADGISQQGELSTLADNSIASINVAGAASNLNLGGGNVQVFSGSFTRTDGAQGTSGVANLSGSLVLAANNFYREFTDDPPLTDAARAQPQMHGSGWVRDLREAMSLGTPEAEALREAVTAFAASDSREAQRGELLERVIAAWAETSGQVRQGGSSAGNDLLHHTLLLEVFNGARFPQLGAPEAGGTHDSIEFISITAWQTSQLTQAWEALADSVYGALAVQTRLSPYLDSIALVIDEAGLRFDTTDLDSLVQARFAADPCIGLVDLLELKKYAGATLAAAGWEPYQAMGNNLQSAVMTPELQSLLDHEKIAFMANGVTDAVANAAGGTLLGNDLANTMVGGVGVDHLQGGAGADALTTAGNGDDLYGEDGNDTLIADGGSGARLDGGAGDDTLRAQNTSGPTTFVGGTGNDTIIDGRGYNDIYLYNLGDGQDAILDAGARDYADTMKFGAGISPADLSTARVGMNLVISHSNGQDKITVLDWFAYSDKSRQIERFEFADGTVWTADQITTSLLIQHGTAEADIMTGVAAFADTLFGEGGNDTLTSAGSGDKLYGGDGNDTLTADGGSGAWLDGGAGDDTLRAQNTGGSTTFVGGMGNDTIVDARGYNDTYLYNLGDGQDTLSDAGARFYADTMKFGAGISPADLSTIRVGMNLVISHCNGQDKITVLDWFAYSDMSRQIERFEFADGTVWTADQITTALMIQHGTAGADTMTAVAAFADVLYGEDGDDTLTTAGSGDKLYGGDGNDTLIADGGSGALLDGGEGDDILRAQNTSGPTTFVGGTGNDTITDARGYNDTYLYDLGDSKDTISDAGARQYADTMKFGAGISPADLSAARVGMNLVISHSNGQDKITVIDWFAYSDMSRQIERFEFADGTVWTADQLTTAALTAHGTAGADTMTGVAAFADILYGEDGDDTLSTAGPGDELLGGEGNDTLFADGGSGALLDGGAGDDILRARNTGGPTTFVGGTGNDTITDARGYNDTYIYNLGDGQDTIAEAGAREYADTIKFGAGIAPADLSTTRVGMDLVISHCNGQDQITVLNWFAYSDMSRQIERFEFADGTVWTANQITTALMIQHGTSEADTMVGLAAFADNLYGDDGDDTLTTGGSGDKLYGGDGNDTLIADGGSGARLDGGAGDDTLRAQSTSGPTTFVGGTGNDTITDARGYNDIYLYNLGDGQDTIAEAGAREYADTIKFGAGIAPADLSTTRVGMDLVISHCNGQDQITVLNWFAYSDMSRQIERFEFADGTVWTSVQVHARALNVNGTSGNDTLNGTSLHADTLNGLDGDDTLDGKAGTDTLVGGTGNDLLLGGAGNDQLIGEDGQDTLDGGDGNDFLVGGAGTDYLTGGAGNDTYLWSAGHGNDTISEQGNWPTAGEADRLVLDALHPWDLSFSSDPEGNLLIQALATGETLRIERGLAAGQEYMCIEQFEFAGGTTWNMADVQATIAAGGLTSMPLLPAGAEVAQGDWLLTG